MVSQLARHFATGVPTRSTVGAVEQENSKLKALNAAMEKELQELKVQLAHEREDREEKEALQALVEKEAAERHERTKEELKQALEKHAQELKKIEVDTAQKLKDLQARHEKTLQENAVASVKKYLSGSRNAFRTDYHANYRYGLLDLMYKHKLSEEKLGHVKVDYNDTLDFSIEPPLYEPPPIGAFSDDGDSPLEVWTHLPLSRDPVNDPARAKLLPDPIRTLRPKMREIARANQANLPPKPLAPAPNQTIADAQRRKEEEALKKQAEAAQIEKARLAGLANKAKALNQKRAKAKTQGGKPASGDGKSRSGEGSGSKERGLKRKAEIDAGGVPKK